MDLRLLRVATALMLLALTFGFSMLAVSRINHRISLGLEGSHGTSDELFSSLIGQSGGGAPGGTGNVPGENGEALKTEPVGLSVTVLDDTSGSIQTVQGAAVNVSIANLGTQTEALRGGSQFVGQTGQQTRIAWGHTDGTGRVGFKLFPGNYTVFAGHFGLIGNSSITLVASRPQTFLRWVFHQRFEKLSVVQMNDDNDDGLISPGETILLFYRSSTPVTQQHVILMISGQQQVSVDLEILSSRVFEDEVYLVVSPLQTFAISSLGSNSTLEVGIIWWEAAAAS